MHIILENNFNIDKAISFILSFLSSFNFKNIKVTVSTVSLTLAVFFLLFWFSLNNQPHKAQLRLSFYYLFITIKYILYYYTTKYKVHSILSQFPIFMKFLRLTNHISQDFTLHNINLFVNTKKLPISRINLDDITKKVFSSVKLQCFIV